MANQRNPSAKKQLPLLFEQINIRKWFQNPVLGSIFRLWVGKGFKTRL
jgi:hypothetical protein